MAFPVGLQALVVSDSPAQRAALVAPLVAAGLAVVEAESGEDALRLCTREPVDAVVADVVTGGLSGLQLCRLLRSDPATAKLPLVLLTSWDEARSRFWSRQAGASAYVPRSAARERLVPALEELLAGRQPRSLHPPASVGASRPPLERLALVMDDLLFEAVLASEARRLVDHTTDRQGFLREVLLLASALVDSDYLAIRLGGDDGSTWGLHARGPWPSRPTPQALAAIGIPAGDAGRIVIAEQRLAGAPPPALARVELPIESGEERLGELVACASGAGASARDRRTLALLAAEVGLVARTLLLHERISRLANVDALTGLNNRRHLTERFDHELARADRYGGGLAVVMVDIDHFKSINDQHGHEAGDHVLRDVAHTLRAGVRAIDLVGRWGGEEFVVVLAGTTLEGAKIVAERLRASVEAMPSPVDGLAGVTCSLGVATRRAEEPRDEVLARADAALYRAKRAGRNRAELDLPARRASSPSLQQLD